jgi:hypothetical protein
VTFFALCVCAADFVLKARCIANQNEKFAMSVDSEYATASMMKSMRGNSESQAKQRVTPALMRTFMETWEDPADVHFKKHRERLFRVMEQAARQRKFSAEYSVLDDASASEAELQEVYCRLVQSLTEKNFKVKASSTRARAFVVSWDPIETPESVTERERRDAQSVAIKRLRWEKRQRALGNPETRSLLERLGFVAETDSNDATAFGAPNAAAAAHCDQDFLGDLLAPPSTVQHHAVRSRAHGYDAHIREQQDSYPRTVLERTKRTADRAAQIAGAGRGEDALADDAGRSLTRSSDDHSR